MATRFPTRNPASASSSVTQRLLRIRAPLRASSAAMTLGSGTTKSGMSNRRPPTSQTATRPAITVAGNSQSRATRATAGVVSDGGIDGTRAHREALADGGGLLEERERALDVRL